MLEERGGSLPASERRQCGWGMTEKQKKKELVPTSESRRRRRKRIRRGYQMGEGGNLVVYEYAFVCGI